LRRRTLASCIVIALFAGACGRSATKPAAPPTITPIDVTLSLGKRQRFQALPSAGVVWSLPRGVEGGYISRTGMYYAPLRAPSDTTITVVASIGSSSAEATVRLTREPADSMDCLAERQSPDDYPLGRYVFIDELPEAIVKVTPSYPDSARVAGVQGTVLVYAHACACGEVMETRIQRSVPMLDSAAADAVRQWIFKPALANGEPVAVWLVVPVRFSLP
jgi:TonB family protein